MKIKVDLVVGEKYLSCGLERVKTELTQKMKTKVDIRQISFSKSSPFGGLFDRIFLYPAKIERERRKDAILHVASQDYAFVLNSAKAVSIVTCHDLIPLIFPNQPIVTKKLFAASISGMKKAEIIIVDSEHTKNDLVGKAGLSGSKIRVVPLGIDKKIFRRKKVKEQFYKKYGIEKNCLPVLYCGNELPHKNFPMLLNAFAKISKGNKKAVLIKVGPSHYKKAGEINRKIIEKNCLQKKVKIFDYKISDEDLSDFYNIAAVCVVPSLYEGFGLPVIEAMACGAPVACSNSSSLPEIAGKSAVLFNPENQLDIAEKITMILKNKKFRQLMIKKGKKNAQRFSWKKTAVETLKVYKELMKTKKGWIE